ncbi:MAG: hypothetical protein PHN56_02595 [Candidatus Nanoarchaeia archaeon]|nr:hypothetical protein [Candidatus Nanoarchaeia archaeon]
MSIDELLLKREEVPIILNSNYGCESIITPIPQTIYESSIDKKIMHECAAQAIQNSLDYRISCAIIYECNTRKKYDEAINEELSLAKTDTNKAKLNVLNKLGFFNEKGESITNKYGDLNYVCGRLTQLLYCEKFNPEFFSELDISLHAKLYKDLKLNKDAPVINAGYSDNFISFTLSGNEVGADASIGHFFHNNFNLSKEKFEKLCPNKKLGYFSHNVNSFYNAIVLRELEISFINLMLKKLK